jgi:ABC-type multidrug transport system ATPase subunit
VTGVVEDEPILVVRDLSRRFGNEEVIRSLSLAVHRGDRTAICGANGSGKSTFLRCVAGTLTPSGGRVRIGPHAAGSVAAAQRIGVLLSQERSFYLRLSGRENLLMFARTRGLDRKAAARSVDELSAELELDDILRERADRCSTGMLQQLAIARALLTNPSLLLFDEPVRSLDRSAVDRFWAALDRRENAAVLMATHNADDVGRCTSRIDFPT